MTFLVAIGMVCVVFLVCVGVLVFENASAEEQRWLQSAVTLILGAAVGTTFRRT